MSNNPLNIIKEKDLKLLAQIEGARELAFKDGKISKKNKLLIAWAIDMAKGAENGIKALANQALENGATQEEILETLRIVNYICGVGSTYSATRGLKNILEV